MYTLSIAPGKKISDSNLSTLELVAAALTASGHVGWVIWKGARRVLEG